MPKLNGLSLKQQKWLEIYLKTGNATEAARKAYNCTEASARVIGHENLTKLNISELFEAQGMTIAHLIKGLIEGVDATKLIKANLIVQKDNGHISNKELIEAAKELNGVYMEVPDWVVRHRYLETILRIHRTKKAKEDNHITPNKWVVASKPKTQSASL